MVLYYRRPKSTVPNMGVEVLLGDEGEAAKVGKLLQVVRMHAARVIDACRFDRVKADMGRRFHPPACHSLSCAGCALSLAMAPVTN